MMDKARQDMLTGLAREYGTPLYVYDVDRIREQIAALRTFDVIRYAMKANSNLALLRWMRDRGLAVDTVSTFEVQRALVAGFPQYDITFTSDLFNDAALSMLSEHPVDVNLGSPDMIEQYAALDVAREITVRINPGFGHGHDRKVNTGGPESKHGIWFEQIPEVVARAATAGLTITGVHMHIGSGSDFAHLSRVRQAMVQAVEAVGDTVKMFSVGGGLPIPYHADEQPFDAHQFCSDWLQTKADLETILQRGLIMEVEPGRYLVAQAGVLLSEVRGTKVSGGFDYLLIDAGFNNLLRPAMYGAYHATTVLNKADTSTKPTVIAGPLCESADVFTQGKGGMLTPVELPDADVGDIVCIHDTGAYGATMASNYNSQPFAPEVIIENGKARLVRRRQTFDDLIALETDTP